MVVIKMLQIKTAINVSRAMRNDFMWPKFLFKSNTMQSCPSNHTSNLKQSYFIADETRDFPCIPVLSGNFQSAPPVFFLSAVLDVTILSMDVMYGNTLNE